MSRGSIATWFFIGSEGLFVPLALLAAGASRDWPTAAGDMLTSTSVAAMLAAGIFAGVGGLELPNHSPSDLTRVESVEAGVLFALLSAMAFFALLILVLSHSYFDAPLLLLWAGACTATAAIVVLVALFTPKRRRGVR